MRVAQFKPEFDSWRTEARALLHEGISPTEVFWTSDRDPQPELEGLFSQTLMETGTKSAPPTLRTHVPADFLERARDVAAHRDDSRWALLYRLVWRITHGEPELLQISIDPDVATFNSMYRSVRRDMHKMKAFVRFRKTLDAESGEPYYVAWHEPDHLIVHLTAPFFSKRFEGMKWSILTPDACAHWNGSALTFSLGCPQSLAPKNDDYEDLWRTYYASIFNPARIKTSAMKKELPVRYWKNLPEARLIRPLIQQAPQRLQRFYQEQPKRAQEWFPANDSVTLADLKAAVQKCEACSICKNATQAVFGEGPTDAKIVFVGEQPGDQEDQLGRPFQGPAGKLLNRALVEAGLSRDELYLTNSVKHFKWTPQGKTRLHQKPNSSEVAACKPWLMAELGLIRPEIIVCLGVTAAQSILGKAVRLGDVRGQWLSTGACDRVYVTTHPAAILRTQDPAEQEREYTRFVDDLRQIMRQATGN